MVYTFQNNRLVTVVEEIANPQPNDPVATKVTYAYYPNGNVQRIDFAYQQNEGEPFVINFTSLYETYDNKPNPEPNGVLGLFIPNVVLQNNNPLKVTNKLADDSVVGGIRYEYTYNGNGLPLQRTQYVTTEGPGETTIVSEYSY